MVYKHPFCVVCSGQDVQIAELKQLLEHVGVCHQEQMQVCAPFNFLLWHRYTVSSGDLLVLHFRPRHKIKCMEVMWQMKRKCYAIPASMSSSAAAYAHQGMPTRLQWTRSAHFTFSSQVHNFAICGLIMKMQGPVCSSHLTASVNHSF